MAQTLELSEEQLAALPIVRPDGRPIRSEKEEKFLREICEFEFYNLEEPGMMEKFPYGNTRNKHTFTLFHGGKYRLPRHVAEWVESRGTPMWDWRPDGTGRMRKTRTGQKPRFQMRQVFGA